MIIIYFVITLIIVILANLVVAKPYSYACPRCNFYLNCDSNSMYPTLNCTNTQVMENANKKNIKLNEIVWFRVPEGYRWQVSSKYIVHRIVGRRKEGWLTRGDNNNITDPWILTDSEIKFIVRKIR